MQGCAYVDGRYVAPEEARISVFDWGFLHSDATYDVAHVWKGRFFRLDAHLERFFASCAALRLDPGKSRDEVRALVVEAGLKRIRPCLMTSVTTIFGLAPIFVDSGRGSDIMQPMAIPSVGGMSVALITLFVIPCCYCLVKEWQLRWKSRQRP